MTDRTTIDDGPHGPVVRPARETGTYLLYLHHGQSAGAHEAGLRVASGLAARTGASAVCTPYRPELADAVEDVAAAYEYCRGLGPVAIAGERLGAWLAATLMIRLRDTGAEQPRVAVLIGALLDLTLDSRSMLIQAGADPGFDVEAMRRRATAWAAGPSPAGIELDPVGANLHGLPPVQLLVAATDPVLDDSLAFAARAAHDRVPVELRVSADREALHTEVVPAAAQFVERWHAALAAGGSAPA
jgi:monoterpene epsilon-lactone hydrolase